MCGEKNNIQMFVFLVSMAQINSEHRENRLLYHCLSKTSLFCSYKPTNYEIFTILILGIRVRMHFENSQIF